MSWAELHYPTEIQQRIITMAAAGKTAAQIAAETGKPEGGIRSFCSRRKIKTGRAAGKYSPEVIAHTLARAEQIGVTAAARELGTSSSLVSDWKARAERKRQDQQQAQRRELQQDVKVRPWLGKAWRLVLASDGHYYIAPRGCELPRGVQLVSRRRIAGGDISRPAYYEGELVAEYQITPVLPALIHSLAADLAGNNRAAADMLALELAAYDGTYPDAALGVTKALKARHAMERAGFYLYATTNHERAAVAAIVIRDLLRLAKSH